VHNVVVVSDKHDIRVTGTIMHSFIHSHNLGALCILSIASESKHYISTTNTLSM
jgi:hypothetical protein